MGFVSPAARQREPLTELLLLLVTRNKEQQSHRISGHDVSVLSEDGSGDRAYCHGGCLGIDVFSKDIYSLP